MAEAAIHFLSQPMWAWLALGAVLLTVELSTGSGWLLWPAACAGFMGLLVAFVDMSPLTAMLIFAAITAISTIISRRMIRLHPAEPDINDPLLRIVGHHGTAVAAFHNGAGRVFVDGKEWAAEAEGAAPKAEQKVEVTGVNGAILKVRSA